MLTTFIKKIFEYLSLIFIFCLITLGCTNKDKYEELKANIISPVQDYIEISVGERLYFQAASSGGIPPYEYSWNFCLVALSSMEKNPGEIVFNFEGVYDVLLTVKDTKSNTSTDFVKIIVGKD